MNLQALLSGHADAVSHSCHKKQKLVLHRRGGGNEAQPLLSAACRAEPLSLGGKTKAAARNHRQFNSHKGFLPNQAVVGDCEGHHTGSFQAGARWTSQACEGICHQEVQTAEIPVAMLLTWDTHTSTAPRAFRATWPLRACPRSPATVGRPGCCAWGLLPQHWGLLSLFQKIAWHVQKFYFCI